MKNCIICDIINHPISLDDTIIYENDILIVKVAKGMVVNGHLLVIPKKHINGMADFPLKQMQRFYLFCKNVAERLEIYMHKEVILFEHGSLPVGRHPKSIVHAHMHIIPYNLSKDNYKKIIDGCQLESIDSIDVLQIARQKDYWYFEDGKHNQYFSYNKKNVPRSIIFKLIAEQEGFDNDYEWRDEKNNDIVKVKDTLLIGEKIFISKMND